LEVVHFGLIPNELEQNLVSSYLAPLLDAIRGYKTIGAMVSGAPVIPLLVHTYAVPFLAAHGITVSTLGEAFISSVVMGILGVVMRIYTTTPVLKSDPIPVQKSSETSKS
jgi:hypothetical protein